MLSRFGATEPAPATAPEAPTATVLAAYLGAMMILVESFVLLAGGVEPFSLGVPATGNAATQLGGIGLATGLALVAAVFVLQENPGRRVSVGGALVGLGALSVVSGGGFAAGLVLAVLSGASAILRRPATLYAPAPAAGRSTPPPPR